MSHGYWKLSVIVMSESYQWIVMSESYRESYKWELSRKLWVKVIGDNYEWVIGDNYEWVIGESYRW